MPRIPESGDEAGGTEAEPTTEDRSEKSVEDAEDEMCVGISPCG